MTTKTEDLTMEKDNSMIPEAAVLVYKNESYSPYGANEHYYLEIRRIEQRGDTFKMAEGRPVSKDTLKKLVTSTVESTKLECDGMLPRNLLYMDNSAVDHKLIWHYESKVAYMHFDKRTKVPSGEVKLPDLIFVGGGGSLKVYVVFDVVDGLNEDTELYIAPFPNTTDRGDICLGFTKKGFHPRSIQEAMQRYEQIFFKTVFTELREGNKLLTKGTMKNTWTTAIKKKKPIPRDCFKKSSINTLGDLFNGK